MKVTPARFRFQSSPAVTYLPQPHSTSRPLDSSGGATADSLPEEDVEDFDFFIPEEDEVTEIEDEDRQDPEDEQFRLTCKG
ncbi:unnamed protein product [Nezara viridula]|uniref:Uncharacterized protein n=1 Tax=Nezara viridula TaxID=85310 RepID=A0A9P0EIN0_NEZVI|nr:unnamed protein product [Nezara viridula]